MCVISGQGSLCCSIKFTSTHIYSILPYLPNCSFLLIFQSTVEGQQYRAYLNIDTTCSGSMEGHYDLFPESFIFYGDGIGVNLAKC